MLTLADVIAMPAVRSADPQVIAGGEHLERPVRWVHTTELADIGPLVRGGDLVLTTGIALPDASVELAAFGRGLGESEVAGLFVELGRRWSQVPDALIETCHEIGLPLVALRREVRFVAMAQAIGERLVDGQLADLRDAQRVHETFTELSISEAGPDQILEAAQQLAGSPVVLENEQHDIVDFRAGPNDIAEFLEDWTRRSTSVQLSGRTTWDSSNGWLVTRLGRRGRGWGRLVIGAESQPPQRLVAVAERAASALAMHRLHDRSRDGHVRRLHHELLVGLLANPSDPKLVRRAEVNGLPQTGRSLIGLTLWPARIEPGRSASLDHQLDELVASALRAAELGRNNLLVAAFDSDVRALLVVPARTNPDSAVDRFVAQVHSRTPVIAAAGSAVNALQMADRTLRDALHVRDATRGTGQPGSVHRLGDLRIRGLLALLGDDDRVTAFAERELGPLLAIKDPQLLNAACVIVQNWDNKSVAAQGLNMSRPVLYDRIAKLERLLDVDLSDAEVRTSLHVALMFHQARTHRAVAAPQRGRAAVPSSALDGTAVSADR